jgi:hypothetical protein
MERKDQLDQDMRRMGLYGAWTLLLFTLQLTVYFAILRWNPFEYWYWYVLAGYSATLIGFLQRSLPPFHLCFALSLILFIGQPAGGDVSRRTADGGSHGPRSYAPGNVDPAARVGRAVASGTSAAADVDGGALVGRSRGTSPRGSASERLAEGKIVRRPASSPLASA